MSYTQMSRQTGIPINTISTQITRGASGIHRRNFEALLRMQFEEPAPNAWVSPVGTVRRMGSLWHDGFPINFLAEQVGSGKPHLQQLLRRSRGKDRVTGRMARGFAGLYDKLADAEPGEFGINAQTSSMCRTFARKKGCVPRTCWDPDTIDDPKAVPQWTGWCGTPYGVKLHEFHDIPVCDPCKRARIPGDPYPGFDGSRLAVLRERMGYSRRRLARESGVDEHLIMYWELGKSRPLRENKLDTLLVFLDATYDDVCNYEGN